MGPAKRRRRLPQSAEGAHSSSPLSVLSDLAEAGTFWVGGILAGKKAKRNNSTACACRRFFHLLILAGFPLPSESRGESSLAFVGASPEWSHGLQPAPSLALRRPLTAVRASFPLAGQLNSQKAYRRTWRRLDRSVFSPQTEGTQGVPPTPIRDFDVSVVVFAKTLWSGAGSYRSHLTSESI